MNNKLATETCVDYKINSRAEQMSTDLKTKTWFLYGGTPITTNVDLNNYTTCGTYNEESSANAQTLTNCPTKYAFMLKVYDATGNSRNSGWAYRIQEVTDIFGDTWRRWGETAGGTEWTWQAWYGVSGYVSATYTFGSNGSSVKAVQRGNLVTLYCQINTADLGTMSTWQQKTICNLADQFKPKLNSYLLFPVVHDSTQNTGGCIIVYDYGTVTFSTRGYTLTGVSTSVWVYATCTYCI